MDNRNSSERRDPGDGVDGGPAWPQRPARPQPPAARPRLDPPNDRTHPASARGGQARGNAPDPASRKPVERPDDAGDTKETRILPVVGPSRFDVGEQTRAVPGAGRQPIAQPAQPIQPVQPQPQQPQVRRPGGWQYERQEKQHDPYESGEQPYTPQGYGPQPQQPTQASPRGYNQPQPQPRPGRNYLSVNVEGAPRRRGGWIVWVTLGVLAIALIAGTAFALAWQGQYAGKIYAGVSALDIPLGGKTADAAKKLLRDKIEGFMAQPVVLTWRGKEWRPSAEQIGLKVDVDSTVNEAFQVGRNADMVSNATQQWYAAQSGYGVPLTVQLNEPAMQLYLNNLAQSEIDQKLFDGDVRLNGTEVVALAGKEGRALRTYDAIVAIREAVAKLEPGKVSLPVEVVQPSVSAEEVQQVEGLLGIRVSGPITATAAGKTLTLDRDALVRFTTIERNPDRTAPRHVDLGWREGELKVLADRWAKEVTQPAQNARFAWNGGAVAVLSESADGFETDPATVIASIKEHAGTRDTREYALPGKVVTPTVSSKDIGALGIKELMGTGVSTFKGSSAERATNIRVAANLLNGATVPPGGTFSFLDAMGGIDEARGFVEGYVIAAERTQRGVGGGVCQVSTTTFRAAFWSGVPITERNQHSYRVGWYEANKEPVGFDAAVFDPGVDLKFTNDTGSYMLVEAVVSPDTLTVNMYGTKKPGEVKLEGPAISNRVPAPPDVYQVDPRLPAGAKKQVETAHGGLDTVITRRIIVPGQPDKIDRFNSSYKAWPNWYIVASPSQVPGGVQQAPNPTPNPGE